MSEEELPYEIKKLEIGPRIQQIKLCDEQLPICFNPFYSNCCNQDDAAKIATDVVYGYLKCNNCRVRRRSESILDECKPRHTDSAVFAHIKRSAKNSTQFKRKNQKKIILRDPILKSLQECLHPTRIIPKSFLKKSLSNDNIGNDLTNTSCPMFKSINKEKYLGSHKISIKSSSSVCKKTSGITTDLSDLVAECQSIEKRSQQLSSHCPERNYKGRTEDDTVYREQQVRQSGVCNAAGSSTSCSQQARINASAVAVAGNHASSSVVGSETTPSSCDVTIDELASYFETFVHIPKKMSSMAEMMYI